MSSLVCRKIARLTLVCIACTCFVILCTAEIFSSVSKMKTLPATERQLLEQFDEFLTKVLHKSVPDGLKGKLEKLRKSNEKSLRDTALVECPLHAFRLARRLVKEWPALLKTSEEHGGPFSEFVRLTRQWMANLKIWPTEVDLSGAANALVRLHHLYNLQYSGMINGHFLNVTSHPMTSMELSYVTKAALNLGFICDAKELFTSLESVREGEKKPANVDKLRTRLSHASVGSVTECDKYNRSVHIPLPPLSSLERVTQERQKGLIKSLYHQMCRDSMQTNIVYGDGKKCYYHYTHISYFKFKAELVNSDPFIVVFHDVISDDEIAEMKDLSFAKMAPSTLAAQVAHEQQLVRVSQNAWLFDQSPVIARVSERVQLITGLSTRMMKEDTHAEPYQVLNYGLGGVYGPHEDSVRVARMNHNEDSSSMFRNSGDRTATWMFYLSDVQLGGATVFPLLGAGIRPKKGTAAFWYNVKRNGQGDPRMMHAGCPVLYGDKWVANKWLREIGNAFTRPCLLEPDL